MNQRPKRPGSRAGARTARLVAGALCVLGGLGALGTACSDDEGVEASDAEPAGEPQTYVAVGSSETVGVGSYNPIVDAWPQVLYRTALDRNTVFVNLGLEGSTVAQAIEEQLPVVRELRPTLVTVWLNVNDLVAGIPAATYERQLTQLVRALRQDGQDGDARVLLANTPPLQDLPAFDDLTGPLFESSEQLATLVAEYNEAIERVAEREGAELVDLHAVAVEAMDDGTFGSLISTDDGFHPSTRGHEVIAEAFAAAL